MLKLNMVAVINYTLKSCDIIATDYGASENSAEPSLWG